MKIKLVILLAVIFISCKNEPLKTENSIPSEPTLEKGESLFQENNCTACHKIDQKVVGPSLQDVAKIYKEKNASLVSFLKEEADPIVDLKMYESMRINLQITKTMTDEELQSLELYILSHSK